MDKIEYKYGSKTIVAEVLYSNRKTLDLRVFPEGNVIVTAPLNTVDYKILEKVKLKSKWILQQQRTFELYKPFTAEKLYIPGNSKEQFENILEENLSLVYDSAKLQEYEMWVI